MPEAYLGEFKNIVPLGSLDNILGGANSKFEQVKMLLSGGGSFGGLAQGIGLFWSFLNWLVYTIYLAFFLFYKSESKNKIYIKYIYSNIYSKINNLKSINIEYPFTIFCVCPSFQ